MTKYKITRKGEFFYLYKRTFLIFWDLIEVCNNLEMAEYYLKKHNQPKIEIKKI